MIREKSPSVAGSIQEGRGRKKVIETLTWGHVRPGLSGRFEQGGVYCLNLRVNEKKLGD